MNPKLINEDGRWMWRWNDGVTLPYVAGGADSDEDDPPAPGTVITIPVVDEPVDPPKPEPTKVEKPAKTFSVEDIEKARQQEKDKLYPQLSRMEEELKGLREEREAAAAKAKEDEKLAKAAAKKKSEEEMDVRQLLEQRQREWEEQNQQRDAQFAAMQGEIERRDAIIERERQFVAAQEYRRAAIEANADKIIPELRDLVAFGNEEEVDKSVESLIERSERILEQVSAAQQGQRQQMRGAPITSPPVGPMDNTPGSQTFTADQIAGMSMEEYSKYRSRLLGAAGQSRSQGLFG